MDVWGLTSESINCLGPTILRLMVTFAHSLGFLPQMVGGRGEKPGPWPEKLAVLFISILCFPVYAVLLNIFTILISTQYYKPEFFILKAMSY